ncbi:MAG: Holliday junction DNA helicase RuvA [Betaproteobacteria bacterium RIFCSPLOWO2_12_FULL_68_19]|nr:MAG: Holliday junction DNA helicase RuvA [Betaproteobacteria bacterium RIFCSPLOWO2_12_FULL_68_19]
MPDRAARTILAFDFGLKRIGVAVGEPELGTAHPLPAIHRFDEIPSLIEEWGPAALVVGRPTSVQGEPHDMTRRAEDFARRLERRFKLPVARVDERYSSVEAQSRLRGAKRKPVDSVAAQLLLEQYFHEAA